ncbi:MAG: potassium transporter TrkG, partial [Mucinivorans sp.]
ILILIQIGGLGIMTITSFFGLFFAGGRSFSGQMVVGDMLSTERLSSLLHTIVRILVVTFSIEAIGAIFLYFAIINAGVMDQSDALYFGIFHSVSAFCNAGFSTLSQGLADPILAALNSVRYVIGLLIIFGGIGFPIFSNFLSIFAHKFRNILRSIYGIRPTVRPRLWSLNSFIVVRTTTVLVISASVLFLIMEWNATLDGMPFVEKLSQAFLMAVTPRTAGFNGVDLTQMIPASMLLTIALMWIGGAPQSTAGGIKVT